MNMQQRLRFEYEEENFYEDYNIDHIKSQDVTYGLIENICYTNLMKEDE